MLLNQLVVFVLEILQYDFYDYGVYIERWDEWLNGGWNSKI